MKGKIKGNLKNLQKESVNEGGKYKIYKLGYGHLGNGITVWNSAQEKNGDFVNVAHIGDDGKITWYDKKLPNKEKSDIIKVAKRHKNESIVREIIKKELKEAYTHSGDDKLVSLNVRTPKIKYKKEIQLSIIKDI